MEAEPDHSLCVVGVFVLGSSSTFDTSALEVILGSLEFITVVFLQSLVSLSGGPPTFLIPFYRLDL